MSRDIMETSATAPEPTEQVTAKQGYKFIDGSDAYYRFSDITFEVS